MAKKLFVANWKMNPDSMEKAENLVGVIKNPKSELKNIDLVICPPFEYLESLIKNAKNKKSPIKFGAQDAFYEDKGAYTGEVSAIMLKNLGVKFVIVGHSERRRILGETDQMINRKLLAVVKSGLFAILCVGENSSVRNKGQKTVENYIRSQLEKDLKDIRKAMSRVIIAYEPVWAIGTGNEDTPQDAVEVAYFIKKLMAGSYKTKVKVLYGGSVNAKNIKSFLAKKEIDGALIGGASVDKKEFEKIIKTVNENKETKDK